MKEMMVKEWLLDKTQDTAKRYNCFINFKRDENGMRLVEDGYVTVYVEEEISESEKAAQVKLSTGEVLGSANGWKTWIPKSAIR